MTTLLLVRHGQTEWNKDLRYQGQLDTPLSAYGRKQAELLADALASWSIAAVYTSDLSRARDTADIVASPHGLAPVPLSDLREASYGEWEGMTYADVRLQYPDLVAARRNDPVGFTPPGGESLGSTADRVVRSIRNIADRHPRENVLVVTHGGPLRMFLARLLEVPPRGTFRLRLDNCSLTIVQAFPRSPILALMNETWFLRGLAPSGDPALGN